MTGIGLGFARRALVVALVLVAAASAGAAPVFKSLHSFSGPPDGRYGLADLVAGPGGVFYGTTQYGGTGTGCNDLGCGTVFTLKPGGGFKIIYSFDRIANAGALPTAGLTLGQDGNLYGTTMSGGANNSGTLFRISPKGDVTFLHSFGADALDGRTPLSSVTQTPDGAWWGTTRNGGSGTGPICTRTGDGCGTVFRYRDGDGLTVMHSFSGELDDAAFPESGLALASDGELYGTSRSGGKQNAGVVYRVSAKGAVKLVHQFDVTHGSAPLSTLVLAADGRLYGTTFYGGDLSCGAGCGTVFSIGTDGSFDLLHKFNYANASGYAPTGKLLMGSDGKVYGTTYIGGDFVSCPFTGCGGVFSLVPGGQYRTLYSFTGGDADGSRPNAGLTWLDSRHLAGVTSLSNGSAFGAVFSIKVR